MIESLQFSTEIAWLDALTNDFQQTIGKAIAARKRAHIALSGGNTPQTFYQHLNKTDLPWQQMEWWLGDERWVAPADTTSNEKMVYESLGTNQPNFKNHFHSWHMAKEPAEAASLYEKELSKQIGNPPIFDLIFLGVGADGHTASLFPNTAALEEKKHCAVAHQVPQLNATRLTLTYPVLNGARQVWFLVRGKDKEPMVKRLLSGDQDIPVTRIQAVKQKLYWLL